MWFWKKGAEVGAHSFSGAVLNPSALKELIPDYREQGCPIDADVKKDAVYYLGEESSFKLPITPPPFSQCGETHCFPVEIQSLVSH